MFDLASSAPRYLSLSRSRSLIVWLSSLMLFNGPTAYIAQDSQVTEGGAVTIDSNAPAA